MTDGSKSGARTTTHGRVVEETRSVEKLSTSGTWQSRFDYGGGFSYQRDDESGYKLLGHRYYDPEIGRFLTRDPIKDGRNWYVYCENDPISGADPTGLYDESIRDMIEKLITAGELDPGSGEMYRTDPVLQKKIELEFGDMKIHGGGLTNADASMTQAEKNDAITRVVKGHKPSWKSNKLRRTRGFINLKGLKFFGKVFKGLALVTLVLEGPEAAARDLVFADEIEALAGAGGGIVNDALDKAASDVEDGYRRRAGFSEDEWAEYF